MKEGRLFYDASTGRFDVLFEDGSKYGGLHCGNCFDVLTGAGWKPTRIEYAHGKNEGWYLIEHRGQVLDGLSVRI